MEEQQESNPSPDQLNLDTLRRQTKDLSDILTSCNNSSKGSPSEELKSLLEGLKSHNILKQIGVSNFDSLRPEDLADAYMQDATEQLNSVEAENSKIYDELKVLTSAYTEDYIQLGTELEGLNCSLKLLEQQGLDKFNLGAIVECSTSSKGSVINKHQDYNFELLDLDLQIEKKKVTLSSLQGLDDILKRVEAVAQVEDTFTGLKVVEFDGNGIRLSLETFIPTLDAFICQSKMEFADNPSSVIHELYIEVYDGTLELKNVEIFPNDVFIGAIFDDAKTSWKFFPSLSVQGLTSSLQWLVQRVQDRILLSTLRRSIVKDANKSRHSFEYSDRDGTVIARMANGVDAFIKLPYCWPLISSTLKLISLKRPNNCEKELSLISCKFEEFGSSMDVQTQQNLLSFVDAIEKILMTPG